MGTKNVPPNPSPPASVVPMTCGGDGTNSKSTGSVKEVVCYPSKVVQEVVSVCC